MEQPNLLEVSNLKKYFVTQTGLLGHPKALLKAVDNVSFNIAKGETLGLVGESGCGKSTVGRTIMHLYHPTAGTVIFNGKTIQGQAAETHFRRNAQMIFQDPYASLNPRMTIRDIIREPLEVHRIGSPDDREERLLHLLEMVGLNPRHSSRYPHEFSGGQRQRIGIARALATNPSFVICDEPISALDVSIQAQVVNLLERLQEALALTYLFIAHDLAMVKHISNRVAVMYLGKIVELAPADELYNRPQHPYTQALLSAIPIPDPDASNSRIHLEGDVPKPTEPPSGCRFRTRCRYAMPGCADQEPPLAAIGSGHMVACHLLTTSRV